MLVVPVEEPTLLPAVKRIVRGVQVHNDLLRRPSVRIEEHLHKQRLHRLEVQDDLLVATGRISVWSGQLQAVQRALASQRTTAIPTAPPPAAVGLALAHHSRQQRITGQLVMVVEVFVAQSQREDTLADQVLDGVFDQVAVAMVHETPRRPSEHSGGLLDLVQQ